MHLILAKRVLNDPRHCFFSRVYGLHLHTATSAHRSVISSTQAEHLHEQPLRSQEGDLSKEKDG